MNDKDFRKWEQETLEEVKKLPAIVEASIRLYVNPPPPELACFKLHGNTKDGFTGMEIACNVPDGKKEQARTRSRLLRMLKNYFNG